GDRVPADDVTASTCASPPLLSEFGGGIEEQVPDIRVLGYVAGGDTSARLDPEKPWHGVAHIMLEQGSGEELVHTSIALYLIAAEAGSLGTSDALVAHLAYYVDEDHESIPESWLPRVDRVIRNARCAISIPFPAG